MTLLLSLRRPLGWHPPPLLAGQKEQLGVDGKQLTQGIFEFAAGIHRGADGVDPLSGNGIDTLLPFDH